MVWRGGINWYAEKVMKHWQSRGLKTPLQLWKLQNGEQAETAGGVKLSSMYTITSFCLQKVVRKHFGLFCLQKFKVKKTSFLYVFVDLTSATLS